MLAPDCVRRGGLAAFRETVESTKIEAVLIHAVYLLNWIRGRGDPQEVAGVAGAVAAIGDAIGAVGVVLHPGSASRVT